jgi:hypothetical protein
MSATASAIPSFPKGINNRDAADSPRRKLAHGRKVDNLALVGISDICNGTAISGTTSPDSRITSG